MRDVKFKVPSAGTPEFEPWDRNKCLASSRLANWQPRVTGEEGERQPKKQEAAWYGSEKVGRKRGIYCFGSGRSSPR